MWGRLEGWQSAKDVPATIYSSESIKGFENLRMRSEVGLLSHNTPPCFRKILGSPGQALFVLGHHNPGAIQVDIVAVETRLDSSWKYHGAKVSITL